MFNGKGLDFMKMMKEAGKMQDLVKQRQEELATKTFEASAGGGMVVAIVNGLQELVDLKIEKTLVQDMGLETMKAMIISAINEAQGRAKEAAKMDISDLLGTLGSHFPEAGS